MMLTGHEFSAEVAAVVEVVDRLLGGDGQPQPDPEQADVVRLRARLGELGLWTAGASEESGGGGDPAAAAAVIRRLARRSAGLAWGSVQAHAAVALLGGSDRWRSLVEGIHAGAEGVAVTPWGDRFDRVDGCTPAPWIVAIDGPSRAWVLSPEDALFEPVRRTGFGGNVSGRATMVGASAPDDHEAIDVDTRSARIILLLGAAAVGLGLAEAASRAALSYTRSREQFGKPLIELEAVRGTLFTAMSETSVLEVRTLDPSISDLPRAAALADAACEAAVNVTAAAVQLHGGYGYLVEYGVERLLRDAISLRAACGSAEACREAGLTLTSGTSR